MIDLKPLCNSDEKLQTSKLHLYSIGIISEHNELIQKYSEVKDTTLIKEIHSRIVILKNLLINAKNIYHKVKYYKRLESIDVIDDVDVEYYQRKSMICNAILNGYYKVKLRTEENIRRKVTIQYAKSKTDVAKQIKELFPNSKISSIKYKRDYLIESNKAEYLKIS